MKKPASVAQILTIATLAIVAVCLCGLVFYALTGNKTPSSPAPLAPTSSPLNNSAPPATFPTQAPAPIPLFAPQTSSVEYRITGTGGGAFVTLENPSGGTEQMDISIPWSYPKFDAQPGQFLYISAQLHDTGTIRCEIYADGALRKSATSTGQYVIASCDDLAP